MKILAIIVIMLSSSCASIAAGLSAGLKGAGNGLVQSSQQMQSNQPVKCYGYTTDYLYGSQTTVNCN